ncbi:bifunctional phosphoribosylaminoimidazolecarboxamide formyltransferase/IMP cyclohydrolase [Eisenibacter elegans]|jgi:phosphoribosylaminoimidazolecarboxamide formyltransferase/IMP cyclohydrolase|uniref:bifunctional phosphoribosylaminoimidazolecarboxamide formyltransferase/IMP cyclohydrolase n=1 Tax=Eisenibacter elegans TaxID=997 RepID=UPI00041C67CF|nr:bifunctional phosphoribosylaminoimidazolecarboxamide formyltransferase/IMP cyclohydrolase [Eisenibacter elegans]
MQHKKINSALISVYHKEGLEQIIRLLHAQGVTLYSTGGTQTYIESLQIPVQAVEAQTGYPSVFGGRVKTLHPKIFGGILYRREEANDQAEAAQYDIPALDLVIVDLYPFEQTVASGADEAAIIEKIDIGGISLIRAAAKNFRDVLIVASQAQYQALYEVLQANGGATDLATRQRFATFAFDVSSHYDSAIFNYFNQQTKASASFKASYPQARSLRYGENPHQRGVFYGALEEIFEQLNGKELSYNNLVDVDAAVALVEEFDTTAYAIIKHTNACGMSLGNTPKEAYLRALAADPVSAFGGVIATNRPVDMEVAQELNSLFFEVLIAPDFAPEALALLSGKKNRILLRQKQALPQGTQVKTLLNGLLWQDKDQRSELAQDLQVVTTTAPTADQTEDLLFAAKIAKHTKSNTIVLAKDQQMLASGVGQTSRVDALKQALAKAESFGFNTQGAAMASDAFFPFPDCVEIAAAAGIKAIVQPGGSVKDQASIDACNERGVAMVFTGIRHFKH